MNKSFIKAVIPVIASAVLVFIDQLTKYLARTYLAAGSVELIPGVFELNYTENRGAAFGMMQGGQVFFIILTVLVLCGLVYAYIWLPQGRRYLPLRIIAVFIFSGAVGNLIDRTLNGYVVDFMYISLIDFPVFNVADIFVSWPAVLLVILLIFKYKETDFKKVKAGHES